MSDLSISDDGPELLELQENEEQDFRDTFLPENTDRLKADIKRLRRQLTEGTEKIQSLRRQIIEEDISQIVVSKITQIIKDPTQIKPEQLEGIQKDIYDQMMEAIYQCSVKEVIGYHRLTGITTSKFKNLVGYRLETFYKQRYSKSYHLFFSKNDPIKLRGYTVPPVIPTTSLARKLLPDNLNGYVYRDGMAKEIEDIGEKTGKVELKSIDEARVKMKLLINGELEVALHFGSFVSRFPTKVSIKKSTNEGDYAYTELETLFKEKDLIEVINCILES
ncbi:hypothetical protein K501DRAFT_337872 [Backusella circina FSU 941]|nr:hypothetical protein K501DRAFT_337872 [Backusella circina FSU 941]